MRQGQIGVFQDKEYGEFLLPLFVHKETGQPLRDQEVVERIADIYEKEGSDTWFTEDPQRFLRR